MFQRSGPTLKLQRLLIRFAIFCDEVHSLQNEFCGMFSHTGTPIKEIPGGWTEASNSFLVRVQLTCVQDLIALRAAYERHLRAYKDSHPERFAQVKDAYNRSTSLTYLIVTVLERMIMNTGLAVRIS